MIVDFERDDGRRSARADGDFLADGNEGRGLLIARQAPARSRNTLHRASEQAAATTRDGLWGGSRLCRAAGGDGSDPHGVNQRVARSRPNSRPAIRHRPRR